jgi:hypothetical protein
LLNRFFLDPYRCRSCRRRFFRRTAQLAADHAFEEPLPAESASR